MHFYPSFVICRSATELVVETQANSLFRVHNLWLICAIVLGRLISLSSMPCIVISPVYRKSLTCRGADFLLVDTLNDSRCAYWPNRNPPCPKSKYLRTTRNTLSSLSGISGRMLRKVLRTVMWDVKNKRGSGNCWVLGEQDVKAPRTVRVSKRAKA